MQIRQLAVQFLQQTDEEKEIMQSQFTRAFKPVMELGKKHSYPLTDPEKVDSLITVAIQLNELYSTGKIVSLGQSPAILVALASLMSNTPDRYAGIAFSGTFFDYNKDSRKLKKRTDVPTVPQRAAYQAYLIANGFDPQSICNKFGKENPFVIVERANTGSGLASFLWMLFSWAEELNTQEALHDAVRIHFLSGFSCINIHLFSDYRHSIQKIPPVIVQLSGCDNFKDRLLSSYYFHSWQEGIPAKFGEDISINAQLMLGMLTLELAKRNLLASEIIKEAALTKGLIEQKINFSSLKLPSQKPVTSDSDSDLEAEKKASISTSRFSLMYRRPQVIVDRAALPPVSIILGKSDPFFVEKKVVQNKRPRRKVIRPTQRRVFSYS